MDAGGDKREVPRPPAWQTIDVWQSTSMEKDTKLSQHLS